MLNFVSAAMYVFSVRCIGDNWYFVKLCVSNFVFMRVGDAHKPNTAGYEIQY